MKVLKLQEAVHEAALDMLDRLSSSISLLRNVSLFNSATHFVSVTVRLEGAIQDTLDFLETWIQMRLKSCTCLYFEFMT